MNSFNRGDLIYINAEILSVHYFKDPNRNYIVLCPIGDDNNVFHLCNFTQHDLSPGKTFTLIGNIENIFVNYDKKLVYHVYFPTFKCSSIFVADDLNKMVSLLENNKEDNKYEI